MAVERQTEIEHLRALYVSYRQRFTILEKQIAVYGEHVAPAHLLLDRNSTREELKRIRKELRDLGAIQRSKAPYVGLNTFDEHHARLFYGRDTLIKKLLEKVKDQQFLAVIGPSGSGKSSVVLAGLMPKLKSGEDIAGSELWQQITLRPGPRPLDTLASELAALERSPTESVRYSKALADDPDALMLIVPSLLKLNNSTRLVLVVDQFEEVWTQASVDTETHKLSVKRELFIQLLLTAAQAPKSPVLIIITMRADFFHRAAEHRELANLVDRHIVTVTPMTPDELRIAIECPAHASDVDFEPGLVDELIKQVAYLPGCLPYLQFTLLELWEAAQLSNGPLTWADYKDLGGVEGAIAYRANDLLESYVTRREEQKLRTLLLRLVQPGDGVADTRRRALLDEIVPDGSTAEEIRTFLEPFTEKRLLTLGSKKHAQTTVSLSSKDCEQATVELSHEALIRGWPTMKEWIDDARAALRLQLKLSEEATEWQSKGKSVDFLWGQARLDDVETWRKRDHPQLTALEQEFLQASEEKLAALRRQAERLAFEQRMGRQLRYLRQAGGTAIGAGLGYGLAYTYLTMATDAGPFLLRNSMPQPDALTVLFFAMFLPGAIVGLSIGLALWRWNERPAHKRIATTCIGACVSAMCLMPFVLFAGLLDELTLAGTLPQLFAAALLGAGLGLGAGLTLRKERRLLAMLLGSIVAGMIGNTIGGFATNPDIISMIIAGILIGGLTGLGLYFVAFEQNVSKKL
jgi:energy-coupling factor transporter ATP-binding protein EcfA2